MKFDKVIFLDIDGVVATTREHNMTHMAKTYVHKYNVYPYNPKCVKVLNKILEETQATIIMSSDWKLYFDLDQLADIFKINGIDKAPVMVTHNFYKKHKGKELEDIRTIEIKAFLEEHEVEKYVVVDDLDMSEGFGNKFVLCGNSFEGIKKSGLKEKIIKKLC
jgi:hypothetical protein